MLEKMERSIARTNFVNKYNSKVIITAVEVDVMIDDI